MIAHPSGGAAPLDRYFGLAGKVVLLTGGTRGIGRAMAEAFAAAGARLAIVGLDAGEAAQVARDLEGDEASVLGIAADVGSVIDLHRILDETIARFGRVDVLACNAGIAGPGGTMGDADDAAFDRLLDVNLRHPLRLSSLVAPVMARHGGGSIILTASIAGLRGNKAVGLYGLTKAALMQLARNLAIEWGPANVRANALAPGLIETSWATNILTDRDASARRMGLTPLRRIGQPWEVAAAALFLAGPGAGFVTGHTLVVDGGTLISDGN